MAKGRWLKGRRLQELAKKKAMSANEMADASRGVTTCLLSRPFMAAPQLWSAPPMRMKGMIHPAFAFLSLSTMIRSHLIEVFRAAIRCMRPALSAGLARSELRDREFMRWLLVWSDE